MSRARRKPREGACVVLIHFEFARSIVILRIWSHYGHMAIYGTRLRQGQARHRAEPLSYTDRVLDSLRPPSLDAAPQLLRMRHSAAGRSATRHIAKALNHLETAVQRSGVAPVARDEPEQGGELHTPDLRVRSIPNEVVGMLSLAVSNTARYNAIQIQDSKPMNAERLMDISNATAGAGIALYLAGAASNVAMRAKSGVTNYQVRKDLGRSESEFHLAHQAFDTWFAEWAPQQTDTQALKTPQDWKQYSDFLFKLAVEDVQAERESIAQPSRGRGFE
jgi:hypothetical protein